jgi:hypothetical protein
MQACIEQNIETTESDERVTETEGADIVKGEQEGDKEKAVEKRSPAEEIGTLMSLQGGW